MPYRRIFFILAPVLIIVGAFSPHFFNTGRGDLTYSVNDRGSSTAQGVLSGDTSQEKPFVVTHIETPQHVKAVYMTSWVAGTPSIREKLVRLIQETEINSIVIDIKDYSGALSFPFEDPLIKNIGAAENRISDIEEFIGSLHNDGVYVIGRVTVFQDPHLAQLWPDKAVQKASDKSVWKDRKGLSFMDAGSSDVWDYHVAIAKEAYAVGFDEINFDYIRFPSDGDMTDIYYPLSEETILIDPDFGKAKVVEDFFAYLAEELEDTDVVTSADLFGMTTTNHDDLNIGQVLERAEPYFDYIAPMVYPSHYPPNFIGIANPAAEPYEVIHYSMGEGAKRMIAASSTKQKLRPWFQDFDLGATYTPERVRAQITALNDLGMYSWMLWDPKNIYTKEALKPFYTAPRAPEIATSTPSV